MTIITHPVTTGAQPRAPLKLHMRVVEALQLPRTIALKAVEMVSASPLRQRKGVTMPILLMVTDAVMFVLWKLVLFAVEALQLLKTLAILTVEMDW